MQKTFADDVTKEANVFALRYISPISSISGVPSVRDMIRTRDLLVRSQTLYPAELRALVVFYFVFCPARIISDLTEKVNNKFR